MGFSGILSNELIFNYAHIKNKLSNKIFVFSFTENASENDNKNPMDFEDFKHLMHF